MIWAEIVRILFISLVVTAIHLSPWELARQFRLPARGPKPTRLVFWGQPRLWRRARRACARPGAPGSGGGAEADPAGFLGAAAAWASRSASLRSARRSAARRRFFSRAMAA